MLAEERIWVWGGNVELPTDSGKDQVKTLPHLFERKLFVAEQKIQFLLVSVIGIIEGVRCTCSSSVLLLGSNNRI
jgi:hypothetical protein